MKTRIDNFRGVIMKEFFGIGGADRLADAAAAEAKAEADK